MSKWERHAFDDIFIDDTKSATKIKKSEYLKAGIYPIIDQGQNVIAGYTNQKDGLYENVPVILFGDHTRNIKYVDEYFFIGADGVKILKSKNEDVDYKYLFYVLSSSKIADTGYNRHFKWLKETKVVLPPLEMQIQIASELDKITQLIEKRKLQSEKLDLLIKAKFVEMFGDPVENPMGWEVEKLSSTGSFKNGINFSAGDVGVIVKCLGVSDFKQFDVIKDSKKLESIQLSSKPKDDYFLKKQDIVFVRSNGNKNLVGRSVLIYTDNQDVTYSGFCIRYRKDYEKLNIRFLLQLLKAKSIRENLLGRGANIQNLNQQILSELDVIVPPIELQNQFADYVKKVEKVKNYVAQNLQQLEILYKQRMQEYFE